MNIYVKLFKQLFLIHIMSYAYQQFIQKPNNIKFNHSVKTVF
jgi:hypothetical protein